MAERPTDLIKEIAAKQKKEEEARMELAAEIFGESPAGGELEPERQAKPKKRLMKVTPGGAVPATPAEAASFWRNRGAGEQFTAAMLSSLSQGGEPGLISEGDSRSLRESYSDFAQKVREAQATVPDPDRFASDVQLARKSGVPVGLLADPEARAAAERAAAAGKPFAGGISRAKVSRINSEKTRRWLSSGRNLAMTHDDLEAMYRSEGIIGSVKAGYRQGELTTRLGRLSSQRAWAALGGGDLRAEGPDLLKAREDLRKWQEFTSKDSYVEGLFTGLGEMAGQHREPLLRGAKYALAAGTAVMLATAAASAIAGTGGLAAPAVVGAGGMLVPAGAMSVAQATAAAAPYLAGAMSAANLTGHVASTFETEMGLLLESLLEIRDERGEPLPDDIALATALLGGAASAGLEFAQLQLLIKSTPGLRSLFGRGAAAAAMKNPTAMGFLSRFAGDYLKVLGAEVGTEFLQEISNVASEELAKKAANRRPGMKFEAADGGDVAERLGAVVGDSAQSFALSLLPGPFFDAMGAHRSAKAGRLASALEAARAADALEGAIEATEGLKISQRDSGSARSYNEALMEDFPVKSVFMSPKSITAFAQEGGPESLRDTLEAFRIGEADFRAAAETGADIEIPVADFVQGAHETGLEGGIVGEARAEPSGMTMSEAREALKESSRMSEEELSKALERASAAEAERASAAEVRANARSQLFALGLSAGESESAASMLAGAMTVAARREGVSPYELFDRLGVSFSLGETGPDGKRAVYMQQAYQGEANFANAEATSTPEFKKWFGGSKTVDEEGKPIFLYRGDLSDKTQFDAAQGNWFTDTEQVAEGYSSGQTYPVYLSMQNPFILNEENYNKLKGTISDKFEDWFSMDDSELDNDSDFQRLRESYLAFRNDGENSVKDFYNGFLPEVSEDMENEELRERMLESLHDFYQFSFREADYHETGILNPFLETLGYDGVIGDYDKNGQRLGKEYIVFSPSQIKSAYNTGAFDPANPNIYYQQAFTGSPYRFYRFSLEHVDSGEGSQEEGYGLYFTDLREIADWYREKNSRMRGESPPIIIDGVEYGYTDGRWNWKDEDGKWLDASDAEDYALGRLSDGQSAEAVIGELEGYVEGNGEIGITLDEDDAKNTIDLLKNGDISLPDVAGQVYKAEIPDKSVLLDRDSAISEQSEFVKEAIQKITSGMGIDVGQDATGSALQEAIAGKLGVPLSDRSVSEALLKEGILGAFYWNGEETASNYVIWDDDAIDILETYYQEQAGEDGGRDGIAGELFDERQTYADDYGEGHFFKIGPASASVIVYDDGSAQIERLDVEDDFQRKGLGRALFQKIAKTFKDTHSWFLVAETDEARAFWEKLGFKEGGPMDAGVGETPMIMESGSWSQTGAGGPRGFIELPSVIPGKPGTTDRVRITLTPRADVTTAIHELGHMFLWLADLQSKKFLDDAQLQEDIAAVREFVGWQDGQEGFTRDQHEAFANAYLAYVGEGRAPSAGLLGAFRRFKKWLADFYRQVAHDDRVELSDEMRGVFDRMLATEEQIEEAAEMAEFDALTGEGAEESGRSGLSGWIAGVRDEIKERTKETALGRLLSELSPERKAELEAIRREVEKEARREAEAMPVYRAIGALRENPELTMSDGAIMDLYGEAAFEDLPEGVSSPEGRLSPDEAAEALGYGSGDELLKKIAAAPAIEDEIRARADAAMAEIGRGAAEDGRLAGMADDGLRSVEALEAIIAEDDEIELLRAEADGATEAEWDGILAADEMAAAEAENPRNRPNVIKWVRDNGGMSYESLKGRYSDDALADLRSRGLPVGFFRKGAQGIDEVAQEMAYGGIQVEGGDDLFSILAGSDPPVSPLAAAERLGFWKAREYARLLRARRGEKDASRRASRAESKAAVAAIAESAKAEARAVLDAAGKIVGNQKAIDVRRQKRLGAYVAAERQARSEYKEAVRARDWDGAHDAKRREKLSHALAMALKSGSMQVARDQKYMDGVRNHLTRRDKAAIEQSRMEQISALFERFGYRPQSKEASHRKSLGEFLNDQAHAGYPNDISAEIVNGSLSAKWWELSSSQLRDLADAVRWLEHNGRESVTVSRNFAIRDLEALSQNLIGSIEEKAPKFGVREESINLRGRDVFERAGDALSSAAAPLTKVEFIVRALDGFGDLGTAWDTIFRPIAEAEEKESQLLRAYVPEIDKIRDAHFTRRQLKDMKTLYFDEYLGRNVSHEMLLAIGLNMGNVTNLERLMTGEGWNEHHIRYLSSQLTENDWLFIQEIWDLANTLWPQIKELQRDITGMEPQKVEAKAFYVMPADWGPEHGGRGMKIEGGYYPIAYDHRESRVVRERSERQAMEDLFETQYARAATRHGHTESRVRSTGYKLRLDLGVIGEHFTNVIHDLAFRKAIIDVDKIIRYRRVAAEGGEKTAIDVPQAIIDAVGYEKYRQLRPWLQHIARGEQKPANYIERAAAWARRRTQVVTIGLKASSALYQAIGFSTAAHRVGPARLARHILAFNSNPLKWGEKARWVWGKSEFMRNRATNRDRDIRAAVMQLKADGKWNAAQNAFFQTTTLADANVTIAIWNAAYEKGIRELNWDEKKAVQYADSIVRNTQDIGTPKDLSAIQRGGSLQKLLTMFYNAANTQFNMIQEEALRARAGKSSFRRAAGAFFWLIAVPAIISGLRYSSGDGGEDDDGAWGNLWWGAKTLGSYPLSLVPGARDVASYYASGYDYRVTPATEVFTQPKRTIAAVGKAIAADEGGDEIDWKSITSEGLMTAGYVFGLPSSQLRITLNAAFDSFDERYDVRWSDYFVYRKREKAKKTRR
jgi:GNAT superfamily N-acetyltransferase